MPRIDAPTAVARSLTLAAATAAVALPTLVAHAQDAVQWRVEDGGNGNWYGIVVLDSDGDMFCWDEARDDALLHGGHLGTLTSQVESDFVCAATDVPVAPDGGSTRVWIGAFQDETTTEPAEFRWVTDEPWQWTNWAGGGPSNDGGLEDFVHFDHAPNPLWNDQYNCWTGHPNYAYLIEWSDDCNDDGIVDYGQILDGTFADDDLNGIPDCCDEGEPCVPEPQSNVDLLDPKVALGGDFGVAITVDGRVITWGSEQIAQVPDIVDPVAVAAGFGGHALALQADGTMVAWGGNSWGQINVPDGLTGVVDIATLSRGSLALLADASVTGWGNNYWCGAGTTTLDFPPGGDIAALDGGNAHWLYRRGSDGHVVGRGCNFNGQWNVPSDAQPPVQYEANESWSCVLAPDGSIRAFGYGGFGRLKTPGGNDFTAIACGNYFGVGLRSDGSISHWGSNNQGQAATPSGVPGEFVRLVAGGDFAGAIRPDGSISLWGASGAGQVDFPTGERIRMGDVDCDGDGEPDWRQIIVQPDLDLDGDGRLDCCRCPGDLDGDGLVDAKDLGLIVSVWGTDGGDVPAADLDGDGDVRAGDLGILLSLWGDCREPDCP